MSTAATRHGVGRGFNRVILGPTALFDLKESMDNEDTMREQRNGPLMLVWGAALGIIGLGAICLLAIWFLS